VPVCAEHLLVHRPGPTRLSPAADLIRRQVDRATRRFR
jgi:hypothetical protein